MRITNKGIDYTVDSVNDLLATGATVGEVCVVTEDGRGGTFKYVGTGTNNSGTIFNGWHRIYDGAVNVKWFVDFTETDHTAGVQNAVDAAGTNGIVYIDSRTYKIKTVTLPVGLSMIGDIGIKVGYTQVNSFVFIGTALTPMFISSNVVASQGHIFRNLSFNGGGLASSILVTEGMRNEFWSCTFEYCDIGLRIYASEIGGGVENKITNCYFSSNRVGVYIASEGASDGFIVDSIFYANTQNGISNSTSLNGWLLKGNHFYGVSSGASVDVLLNTSKIIGNYFEGAAATCLKISPRGSGGIVSDNTFWAIANDQKCLVINGDGAGRYVIVTDNLFACNSLLTGTVAIEVVGGISTSFISNNIMSGYFNTKFTDTVTGNQTSYTETLPNGGYNIHGNIGLDRTPSIEYGLDISGTKGIRNTIELPTDGVKWSFERDSIERARYEFAASILRMQCDTQLALSIGTNDSLTLTSDRFIPYENAVISLGEQGKRFNTVYSNLYNCQGVTGVSGTYTTADAKTVTVVGGIITSIV